MKSLIMIKLWLITFAIKYVFILQLSKLGHQLKFTNMNLDK